MLKPEDNQRLTAVGPGTPAGKLFRMYWQPALLSSELPEADGAPIRVRLLGEDLIAFRNTDGHVGLVDAFCPHRRAPLFFGRNEECGIRCVFHGWKFDINGKCLEVPSEPPTSRLKDNVALKAYPTVECGGLVWAYLGPQQHKPAPPNFEWLRAPATHRHVSKTYEHCNYLQALEGGLDTTHSSFVHNNRLSDKSELRQRDRSPKLDVEPTDYGYYYVSTRNAGDDGSYVRVYQYVMPNHQMRGGINNARGKGRNKVPKLDGHIWVPIDDEQTMVYNWMCAHDAAIPISAEYAEEFEKFSGRGKDDFIPGTFRLKRNLDNDYLIDRSVQKASTYTGIEGLNTQDYALQEGMGPIVDRSLEHLGASDRAIVVMRRLLLEAIQEVEQGGIPRAADPESYAKVRPHDGLVALGQDWKQAFANELIAKW